MRVMYFKLIVYRAVPKFRTFRNRLYAQIYFPNSSDRDLFKEITNEYSPFTFLVPISGRLGKLRLQIALLRLLRHLETRFLCSPLCFPFSMASGDWLARNLADNAFFSADFISWEVMADALG